MGPESASSNPGPTCYRKNGPLTVTDANLLLGRLIPDYFPKIFGPNENEPLDFVATKEKFKALADDVHFLLFFFQSLNFNWISIFQQIRSTDFNGQIMKTK